MLYIYDKHHLPSNSICLEDADLQFFAKLSKKLITLVKDPIVKYIVKSIDNCILEDSGNVVTGIGAQLQKLLNLSDGSGLYRNHLFHLPLSPIHSSILFLPLWKLLLYPYNASPHLLIQRVYR